MMKRTVFLALLSSLALVHSFAAEPAAQSVAMETAAATASDHAKNWLLGSRTRFALNPVVDLSFAGSALGLNLVPFLVDRTTGSSDLPPFDPATVWGFDRALMAPYNANLDTLSDITQYAAFLAPAVLAAAPVEDWVSIGTMYLETALLAWGLKETGKTLIARARPYLYADGYPADSESREDWFDSFPSGHTTMAFAGASFASYTFAVYYPDSPWRWVVMGASYGLALSTAILRVASGSHFASDVIVGALVGSAAGLLVPMLHRVQEADQGSAGTNTASAGRTRVKPSFRILASPAAIAISIDLQ